MLRPCEEEEKRQTPVMLPWAPKKRCRTVCFAATQKNQNPYPGLRPTFLPSRRCNVNSKQKMDWTVSFFCDTHKNNHTFRCGYFYGATGGTRTPDLLITNQLLYQLSHGSVNVHFNTTFSLRQLRGVRFSGEGRSWSIPPAAGCRRPARRGRYRH